MYIKPNSIFLSDNKAKVYGLYGTTSKEFAKTQFSFVKIETFDSFDCLTCKSAHTVYDVNRKIQLVVQARLLTTFKGSQVDLRELLQIKTSHRQLMPGLSSRGGLNQQTVRQNI